MREGCPLYWDQECLCIVQRDAEGLRDWGWVTMADSCRAYRDMYPGDVECVDADFRRVE